MSQAASDHTTDNKLFTELSNGASKLSKAARGALTRIGDNGNEWFQELVKTGESLRAKTARETGQAKTRTKAEARDWRARVAQALGLPTREEMESLDKKLNRISRKVNKLAREQKV